MELLILISGDLAMSPINFICSEMYPMNFESECIFLF